MSADLVAIGEPLYELNRQPDGRYLPGFGGDTSNVAIAAARLGVQAAYVTRLGGDMFGDELMALWQREGVDVSGIRRDADAATGLYFVTHEKGGHRFTYVRKGSAASRMTPDDVPEALISGARILHASAISQAIGATAQAAVSRTFDLAAKAGAMISYDVNFRPALWQAAAARPVVEASAARAAILKVSVEDSSALFGIAEPPAVVECMMALGAEKVVVTLGAQGVMVAAGGRVERVAGYPVTAVDATGAGDCFTGALLAGVLKGESIFEAARFANAAAAVSTMGYGAIAPLPRRADVEAFMRERD